LTGRANIGRLDRYRRRDFLGAAGADLKNRTGLDPTDSMIFIVEEWSSHQCPHVNLFAFYDIVWLANKDLGDEIFNAYFRPDPADFVEAAYFHMIIKFHNSPC
jgi:hypothetical protein